MTVSQPISSQDLNEILILTGPTGSGKSTLGQRIALECNAEIISLDSMTLYRGMDIGTAKPSMQDRQSVPYHLIDVLDPWENASVAWWLEQASSLIRAIRGRRRRVLLVGGTALYLKAFLFGLFDGPGADFGIREKLDAEGAADPEGLFARLATVDPPSAQRIHRHDLRRIVRALEVWELTGRPLSVWQAQWSADTVSSRQPAGLFWINLPRHELHRRIEQRTRAMFEAGWVDEAGRLLNLPQPLSLTASQAVGYQELFHHLQGRISEVEVISRIQMRTRQFAKRQVTWFRHLPGCEPITQELTFPEWDLRIQI